MAQRNRIDPFGRLIETSARGAWMGNRGCLHDRQGRITERTPPTRRWIVCRLEFKGRQRRLLQPGRYTELFFLDEATALAAGHRPCFECRREDALRFAAAWPLAGRTADAIDAQLARERGQPIDIDDLTGAGLPEGCMVAWRGAAWLLAGGRIWAWAPAGYRRSESLPAEPVRLLTPPSTAAALARGYRAQCGADLR